MSLQDDIDRGDRAAILLQDETFKAAVNNIVNDCITGWRNSRAKDSEGREALHRYLAVTDSITKELQRFVDNGRMARAKLNADEQAKRFDESIRQEAADAMGIDKRFVP